MNVFIILSLLVIVIGIILLVASPSVLFKLNWEEKMIVFERHEHLSVGLALAKGVKDIIIGSDLVGIGQYHRHEYPRASLIYIWRKLTMKQLHKSDKIVKILDYESKKAVKEAVKDGANGAEG